MEVEAARADTVDEQGRGVFKQACQRKIDRDEFEFAGLDFRDVENLVDDGQQVACRAAHFAQSLELGRIVGIAFDEMGETDDGVHRGADFMAHVGQEGALGAIGFLGDFLGQRQFAGAGGDQFLEVVAMFFEFGVGLALCRDVVDEDHQVRFAVHLYRFGRDADQVALSVGADAGALEVAQAAVAANDLDHFPAVVGIAPQTGVDGRPANQVGSLPVVFA